MDQSIDRWQESRLPINRVANVLEGKQSKGQDGSQLKTNIRNFLGNRLISQKSGPFSHEYVDAADVPLLGSQFGFLKNFPKGKVFSIFTTKGGVLKTTLTLNIARMLAWHGHRVLVIGLDLQGDITRALGADFLSEENLESNGEEKLNLEEVMNDLLGQRGLYDFFAKRCGIEKIIYPVIQNKSKDGADNKGQCLLSGSLSVIPETAELAALNDQLFSLGRREYWLRDKVLSQLREQFDTILLDCGPNWNHLATNALIACDVLCSPLECKINNFRNFQVFSQFLDDFQNDMQIELKKIFIPTLYSPQKKLSMDIKKWYEDNLPDCTSVGMREANGSEEATALHLSIIEHQPRELPAKEMREVLQQIGQKVVAFQAKLNAQPAAGSHPNVNVNSNAYIS